MTQEITQLTNSTSDLIEIEKQNPFLTSKVKRKVNSKDCRILFLYPNERGMSTIPPSITSLSQILKDEGHQTALFDTTFYKFDDEITLEDSDDVKAKAMENRPILERDDDDLHFKKPQDQLFLILKNLLKILNQILLQFHVQKLHFCVQ